MVPDELVLRWENAYRRYGEASKASRVAGDRAAAREMALASREVSLAWRAIDARPELPWWAAAAVSAAAEAFEVQAREWTTRAELECPADNRTLGPQRGIVVRPQPWPRHRGEGQ